MFVPSKTLVLDESSGREAKAGGGGVGADCRRRFPTATQYFRFKRRSQIFIMRWRYNIWVSSRKEEPDLKRERKRKTEEGQKTAGPTNNKEESPRCEPSEELIIVLWSLLWISCHTIWACVMDFPTREERLWCLETENSPAPGAACSQQDNFISSMHGRVAMPFYSGKHICS